MMGINRDKPGLNVVGVLDFDGHGDRYRQELQDVPTGVKERVFLLGTLNNPEKFKASIGLHFEPLGQKLAQECYDENFDLWIHEHLIFLENEVNRAKKQLRQTLFDSD